MYYEDIVSGVDWRFIRCYSYPLIFAVTRVPPAAAWWPSTTATWLRPPSARGRRPGPSPPRRRLPDAGPSPWRPRAASSTRVTSSCRPARPTTRGRGAAATTRRPRTAAVRASRRPSTRPSTGSWWSAVRVSARRRLLNSLWRQSSWPHRIPASVSSTVLTSMTHDTRNRRRKPVQENGTINQHQSRACPICYQKLVVEKFGTELHQTRRKLPVFLAPLFGQSWISHAARGRWFKRGFHHYFILFIYSCR